jgi:hypothetical protein
MDTIKQWKQDILYCINNKPHIECNQNNTIKSISFKRDGKYHNIDFPAYMWYCENGNIGLKEYYFKGKRHRPLLSHLSEKKEYGGPAYIEYDKNNNIKYESYWFGGKCHRPLLTFEYKEGGPARIWYYKNGNVEREEYWVEDKKIIHI